MKLNELYELTDDLYAMHVYGDDGVDLPRGDVVILKSLYNDEGYWSDDDPTKYESPFPAAEVEWNGLRLCSIHVKCLKQLGGTK